LKIWLPNGSPSPRGEGRVRGRAAPTAWFGLKLGGADLAEASRAAIYLFISPADSILLPRR
jgi:hypothetical protein